MLVLELLGHGQRRRGPLPHEVIVHGRKAIVRKENCVGAENARKLLPRRQLPKPKGKRHQNLSDDKRNEENLLLLQLVLPVVLRVEQADEGYQGDEVAEVDQLFVLYLNPSLS